MSITSYEALEKMSSGGMGTIYRANHKTLKREVAIKTLIKADVKTLRRFELEAQIAAKLEHPHIIKIFDYGVGEFPGSTTPQPYLVMELLRGGNLADRIGANFDNQILYEPHTCVQIIADLADALDYAHRTGIIHRDIKPANIMFDSFNRPIITDFGIAKILNIDNTVLTVQGEVIGTPRYMAPEQREGAMDLTDTIDQYALALVAYEMLTGRMPFKKSSDKLISVMTLRADLPAGFDNVFAKALAQEAAQRYPTVSDFASALGAAMIGREKSAPSDKESASAPKPTFGERRVAELLGNLDRSQYEWVAEPRIDTQKSYFFPDFIAICRDRGVAVIEVKDWKKIISATQQVVTIESEGKALTLENPTQTARDYALALSDQFRKNPVLLKTHKGAKRLSFPWQEVVILAHISQQQIDKLTQDRIFPPDCVFGLEVLKDPQLFESIFSKLPWRFKLSTSMTLEARDAIRSIINPEVALYEPDGTPLGYLTTLQETLINEPIDLNKSAEDTQLRLVSGVAGSGKTLVLVKRAQWLRKNFPNASILVSTHNIPLANDLRERIADPSVDVIHFYKLCRDIIGEAWTSDIMKPIQWLKDNALDYIQSHGMSVEFVAEEIKWRKEIELYNNDDYLEFSRDGRGKGLQRSRREIINELFSAYLDEQQARKQAGRSNLDWEDVPREAHSVLQADPKRTQYYWQRTERNYAGLRGKGYWRHVYDAILVDEAQDFAPIWFDVVKELIKPSGSYLLCSDPTQSIFSYTSWKEKGLSVVGRTRKLTIPFRPTIEISKAAFSLIDADKILQQDTDLLRPSFDAPLRSGEPPRLIECNTPPEEIEAITERINRLYRGGIRLSDIAIFTRPEDRDYYTEKLEKNNIPVSHPRKEEATGGEQGPDDKLYVDTYLRMRGLEFSYVFLPGLDLLFSVTDDAYDEYFVANMRQQVYIGMTRARVGLYLLCVNQLPFELRPIEPFVWREQYP